MQRELVLQPRDVEHGVKPLFPGACGGDRVGFNSAHIKAAGFKRVAGAPEERGFFVF